MLDLKDKKKKEEVLRDLAEVINKHNLENSCDTPDFIIAEHLWFSFVVLVNSVYKRAIWSENDNES
jgi:hypothetical protein